MSAQKITCTIDDELLNRIDSHCKQYGISRSGFLASVSAQYLNTNQALQVFQQILQTMVEIRDIVKEKGELSPDDSAKFELLEGLLQSVK